ncbi:MAG TPA: DUF5069 domain-containing protein [Nitrospiraceae bacterium]|nr:DUF5069 domain-containing protein [Nitrospiraceae bacterium]
MDLRTRYPRSLKEKLAGHVHLGRMIDKCRAVLAGTQGEYIFPCSLDHKLLDFSRLTPEQFLQAVKVGTDHEVTSWFVRMAAPHSGPEIDAWNKMMLEAGPDTEEKWAYFNKTRNAIASNRTDISTWADLLDFEEKRRPVKKPG